MKALPCLPRSFSPRSTTSSASSKLCSISAQTLSREAASINGPIATPLSMPSPMRVAASAAERADFISSKRLSCTSTRRAAVHCWPEMIKAAAASLGAIAVISASCSTRQQDLPPSSSESFFIVGAAACMMRWPTRLEPVKLTTSTSSWVVRICAISCPVSNSRLTAPLGICASANKGAKHAALNKAVCGAALMMLVQPTAIAGARARASSTAGAFQGMMRAATPAGSRSITASSPGATSSA